MIPTIAPDLRFDDFTEAARRREYEELLKTTDRERAQELRTQFACYPKAGLLDTPKRHTFKSGSGLAVKVPYGVNARRDFIRNEVQVTVVDKKFNREWVRMDREMNELYGEMRRLKIYDSMVGPALLLPGMVVAVFDSYNDPIGRFRRAEILQVLPLKAPERAVIMCNFFDDGRTVPCRDTNIYLLALKFASVPARTISVELRDVRPFVGSPKFGRIFETVVFRYAHGGFSIIFRDQKEPAYEVQLFSSHLVESINEYLIGQLALPDQRELSFMNPIRGAQFERVSLMHVKNNGRVFLRLLSRLQEAIDEVLKEANEDFPFYREFYSDQELFRRDLDEVCVGIHPTLKEAKRCKILAKALDAKGSDPTVTVVWIDVGNQSDVPVSELIPGHFVSKILTQAPGQAQEFQLANIEKLRSKSKFFSVVPENKPLTMRVLVPILDTGSTKKPEIELLFENSACKTERPRWNVINDELVKFGLASPHPVSLKFWKHNLLEMNELSKPDLTYHLAEWTSGKNPSPSYATLISPGDSIAFYMSSYRNENNREFYIHPHPTKLPFESMRDSLAKLEQVYPWVQEYFQANWTKISPKGDFCLHWNGQEYQRARVIGKVIQEDFAYGSRDRVEVLLIDFAQIVRVPLSSLFRMLPSMFFTKLGPQAAIGTWHSKSLESRSGCTSLNQEIHAVVLDLFIDHAGRAFMVLDPLEEEETTRKKAEKSNL